MAELISIEIEHRRKNGEAPAPEEYSARWPENRSAIYRIFGSPVIEIWDSLPTELLLPSASNKETISRHDDESIFSLAASTNSQDLSNQSANLICFGRYQIIRTLGSGGMGTVYLAHDTELDRSVALKIPKFQPTDGPQFQERFRREARLAAKLDDPAIG